METSKNKRVTCREWPRIRVSKLRRRRRAAASHHRAEQVEVEESTRRQACAAPALCHLGQRQRRKQSTASRPRATDSIPASSSDERPCNCYDILILKRGPANLAADATVEHHALAAATALLFRFSGPPASQVTSNTTGSQRPSSSRAALPHPPQIALTCWR